MRVRAAYYMFEIGGYRTRGIETRGEYGVLHRDQAVASSDQFQAPPRPAPTAMMDSTKNRRLREQLQLFVSFELKIIIFVVLITLY